MFLFFGLINIVQNKKKKKKTLLNTVKLIMSSLPMVSEIELIVFYFIKIHYDNINVSFPVALKYIILSYSQLCISPLLTINEDLCLFNLFKQKLLNYSIKRFKLLYRASDNFFDAHLFHQACDGQDKKTQIIIIKSNHGNIFGGYTSRGWQINVESMADKNAFLFVSRSDDSIIQKNCPILFEIKSDKINKANHYCLSSGPIFGDGYDIYISDKCNEIDDEYFFSKNSCKLSCYYNKKYPNIVLCGGNSTLRCNGITIDHRFEVIEYEVYQVVMK